MLVCLLVFILGCMMGCAPTKSIKAEISERPRWIDDPQRMYPFEMYIAAVGSGDTPEAAKSNAIAGVSTVFRADVKAGKYLEETYFETGTDKDLTLKKTSSVLNKIKITTEQSLKNIVVGKTWLSPTDARHYALAYIDRDETMDIYLNDIKIMDGEVSVYFDKYRQATNDVSPLTRLAYINKAVVGAASRDILIRQFNTLSQGQAGYTPKVAPSDLVTARHEARRNVRVRLDMEKVEWPEIENSVREVLQSFGFSNVKQDGEYILSGKYAIEHLDRDGFFVRWHIDLHLKEAASQREFLTFSDGGREGHQSFPEAERRAARIARKNILNG
jgi:hypothetical protein